MLAYVTLKFETRRLKNPIKKLKDLTRNKSDDHEKNDHTWSNFIRVGLLLTVFLSI